MSFAIKLWHFLDSHPIEKDYFDIALTIEDLGTRVCLVHNEFNTYQAIQLAAENNISICFGAAAITSGSGAANCWASVTWAAIVGGDKRMGCAGSIRRVRIVALVAIAAKGKVG